MINGPSIPMPSVKLELGRYVTLRPRKDGTVRVLMEVPPRLRPSGWSAAIPLPVEGARTGNLFDLGELDRIRTDAAKLYARLLQARTGVAAPETYCDFQAPIPPPGPPCPKCGSSLHQGYGLAGGGMGAYEMCEAEGCGHFEKWQDAEMEG